MTTLHRLALAALAVAGFAATAPAQYPVPVYRNPFPPAPPPPTQFRRPPLILEQPVYSPPPVIVQAPPVVLVQARPRVPVYECLDDFERCFRPCPGHHHVIIVHPVSKRPVEVCFDLPDCKLRDFDVRRRSVEFDYGKHEVKIEFNRDGTVCVHDGHGH